MTLLQTGTCAVLDACMRAGPQARKEGERHVRRLFEAAVDAYGAEDADIWLAYTHFEVSSPPDQTCEGPGAVILHAAGGQC